MAYWSETICNAHRLNFIPRHRFNESLLDKIAADLPTISPSDIEGVLEGRRQFLTIAHYVGKQCIGMPSKIVDVGWHHFIFQADKDGIGSTSNGRQSSLRSIE